jgi:hypothetical protein
VDQGTRLVSGQTTAFSPFALIQVAVPNPVPTLTGLNPTNKVAGENEFVLTVTGSNFVNGAEVHWNGMKKVTQFGSGSQLTATIPASDIAQAGQANVTVFNPGPGGGTSAALDFTILSGMGATITVTTSSDTQGGGCSLRSAIQAANTNGPVDSCSGGSGAFPDLITFGVPIGMITLTADLPPIEDDLRIDGEHRAEINGADLHRPFQVNSGAHLQLQRMIIRDGAATMGGGILNRGTLTLTDVTMTGHGATAGSGGAIFTDTGTTLHVSGSRFESNLASDRGGAIWVDSGATVTMTSSVVLSNTATQGGGIYNRGILGLEYVSIRNNSAQNGNGGGVNNSGGSLILSGSAIATNVAQAGGGGLYSAGLAGSTSVTIVNSTITGNIAQGTGGAFGGGVAGESGTISFYNATIVDNTSAAGGGSGVHRVVTGPGTGATFDFRNTIVVGHRILGHPACSGGPAGFVSNGHNLDEDNTCNLIVNSDLPGGNANLSLAATLNGGTTESHSLQVPSDAIDAGDQSVCQANPVNGGDQRGFGRSDGMCDIGAFEFQALAG